MAQVHIVLAAYNGEKYIREQLDSLLANSFQDFFVEVCDDGSTDRTTAIVREYAQRHECIGLHTNETNLGYVKNFMEGIKRSKSPYIMLCDQDDIWHRDKIEKTLERMKRMEQQEGDHVPLLVFTDAMNFDSELGKETGSFHKTSHLNVKKVDTAHLFMENKCIGCTVMMNAAIRDYLTVLPEEIRVHDWWLALICSHFGKISYIEETTLQYRQHSGNMIGGSGFFAYFKKRIHRLREQKLALEKTYAQGKAFFDVFGTKLSGDKKRIAEQFAGMHKAGGFQKRMNMIRYGFCKSGIVRNIALFLLL